MTDKYERIEREIGMSEVKANDLDSTKETGAANLLRMNVQSMRLLLDAVRAGKDYLKWSEQAIQPSMKHAAFSKALAAIEEHCNQENEDG